MAAPINFTLVPGEKINISDNEDASKVILGPGLKREDGNVCVKKPGILQFKEPNIYWIETHNKRYVPSRGESVIGIITNKGDIFRVDIGSSELASLSYLAFESATKRNRPDVKIGDIVYGRLSVANKDMEPELVCITGSGKSGGFGVIRDGGYMFTCSLYLCRKILLPKCVLLGNLGKCLPYEIAVGVNGRIWIKGRSTKETIALVNAILCSEHMDNEQIKAMCSRLTDTLPRY